MKKATDSLQSGEGDMHEVCEIAAKMSDGVPWTGHQTNHSTLFSNTVRTPSVQALFGEKHKTYGPYIGVSDRLVTFFLILAIYPREENTCEPGLGLAFVYLTRKYYSL